MTRIQQQSDGELKVANLKESRILIVDDQPDNLRVLAAVLEFAGYANVKCLNDSREILSIFQNFAPDLVLLDLHMPHVDGLAAMDQLFTVIGKDDYLPVLVLTGDNTSGAKEKALSHGAKDFLSKPFNRTEVELRVKNLLETRHLHLQLKAQNTSLEQQVRARTRELANANERLTILDRSKNDFLNLISHEFRTPLFGLLGAGELIMDRMSVTEENLVLQEVFNNSRRRILSILDDALLLSQIEVNVDQFRSEPISLHAALSRAIETATGFAKSRRVAFDPPPGLDLVLGNEDLLVRALHALLETAVKFSQEGGTIRLAYEVVTDSRRMIIESYGRTIPSSALAKFFDIFSIGEAITPGGDLGLGPPVAYRIFLLFSASLSVANLDPPGIRLTVSWGR
jgi:two-component system, sensor histidine kinase and response regulator